MNKIETERAVETILALANRRVLVTTANEGSSQQLVSRRDSLLHITRADLVNGIGPDTLAGRNIYPPSGGVRELPGDITLGTPIKVNTGNAWTTVGGMAVNQGGKWYHSPAVYQNNAGQWGYSGNVIITPKCRSKIGITTLCGFSEFAFPSVPPKKYRTKTYYGGDSCISGGITYSCSISGSCVVDKNTCVQTSTAVQYCGGSLIQSGFCWDLTTTCGRLVTFSRTLWYDSPIAEVCSGCLTLTDNYSAQLTDEDTEDDAIARVTSGMSWTDPGNCSSFKSLRGAGDFSLAFQVSEVAAGLSGMTVGQDYDITFNLGSRPYGSTGPYTPIAPITLSITATSPTDTTPWEALQSPDSGEEIGLMGITIFVT